MIAIEIKNSTLFPNTIRSTGRNLQWQNKINLLEYVISVMYLPRFGTLINKWYLVLINIRRITNKQTITRVGSLEIKPLLFNIAYSP